jgi:hypothetical protein
MTQPRLGRDLIGVGSDNPHALRKPAGPPHPARGGSKKRRRAPPSPPRGRGLDFQTDIDGPACRSDSRGTPRRWKLVQRRGVVVARKETISSRNW